ncbi:ImmA/IrrE family metallo-endopeptidase [uncultured Brevundimonas sp.]|uniref:ImmA/IrrE family metallo-endopeptidase n=1 Tax=uncultured Brevundimonas sp. TaxID=213418 RepID=UPI0026014490|nr:ImmA/IrrE family metallo-endopeptidase [uncultured Brevundimonas sp.]
MSDMKAIATPRSTDSIRHMAHVIRDAVGYRDLAKIHAEHLLEVALPTVMPNFIYDIRTAKEMAGADGYAAPDRDYIAIREDVYFRARNGSGMDLFTVAHELGHLILHQSENMVLRRSASPPAIFAQPEWQADTFAAEFLMDLRKIRPDDDATMIQRRFSVSVTAARRRIKFLQKTGLLEEVYGPRRISHLDP